MAVETYANQPSTTVSSGGTTAPAGGTVETWTVTSSGSFPAASSTAKPATQFHVIDTAPGATGEIIAVTDVSGTTWTVTRGAESTAPIAHAASFTITQVVTAAALGGFVQRGQGSFVPTAVKTTTYTAVAGDFVPCDTTSGSFTVTLPNTPADLTVVAVKQVVRGGTNTVTVACAGSDVFNVASGVTSATLTLASQAILLQYKSSGAIWYVIADDLPLSQLDSRYLQDANNLSDVGTRQTALNNLAGAQTNNQVLRGNGTNVVLGALVAADLPAGTTSAQGALQLDGTAGDIQPTGTAAAAGAVGKPADAAHVHKQGSFGQLFGTGADASVTFDGSTTILSIVPSSNIYTLTRDIHCTAITINNGVTVKPAQFRIFCRGTITNNGTITVAGNNAAGATAGALQNGASLGGGRAGGAGGTGVSGTGGNGTAASYGGNGGAGGAGTSGAAGSGGTATQTNTIAQNNILQTPYQVLTGFASYAAANLALQWGSGGGGGGSDASSNAGGGGGGGASIVALLAWAVVNNGTITANGGNGGNAAAGNAGGGGGGSGGLIVAYTLSAWTAGTATANAGTHGNGAGTGSNGSDGNAGLVLNVVIS